MLQELLDSVAKIGDNSSGSVNFLELIGQESRELTHSKMIASLLDPNGVHGQGTLFLRLFVDTFLPGKLEDFDFESAKVEIEKDCGKIGFDEFDNAIGGRIDIYIEDVNNNVIAIENKIYALDQPNQLGRYFQAIRTSKSYEIIYLTLDGHEPSMASARGTTRSHLNRCSYHEHVIQWLNKSLSLIKEDSNLRFILEQYISVLRKLTEKYAAAKFIAASWSNMKAALLAESSIEIARQRLVDVFMSKIAGYYTEGHMDSEHIDPSLFRDKEGCHLIFNTDCLKVDVCIEWRLFIRVSLTEEGKEKFPQGIHIPKGWIECDEPENIAWRYITVDGEKLDFHNISKPVQQFLDLNDDIEGQYNEITAKSYGDIEQAIKEFSL